MNEVTQQVRVGVGAFVINPVDGRFLLQQRIASHGYATWGLPGGHQEFGENPAQTAARECGEEIGLMMDESDFTPLGFTNDFFAESNKHYITLFYAGMLPAGQAPQIMEPDRMAALQWFSLADLPTPLFQPCANYFAEQWAVLDNFIETVKLAHAA